MLVNLHTAVIGVRPEISLAVLAATERAPTLKAAQVGERRVWFSDGWHQTPIYARDRLPIDARSTGRRFWSSSIARLSSSRVIGVPGQARQSADRGPCLTKRTCCG